MATVLKCKMCGGDIENNGNGVATCLYCGSTQIMPKLSDERKANLYDRANHYRSINEFDKATAIYEQILAEDNTDAEVYWDIVLCRYGVEYVEDPGSHERIPTVNRAQYRSVFDDKDYQQALANATDEQKAVIEAEATRINSIQKGILDISSKEDPYDIFICYKETDNNGRRTLDSVLAQDIYNELVKENYNVFFSRISLEDKIGTAYEPYIFAALHSAKVMIVVGTNAANFNAVWVKNEWMRFLSLINSGEKKVLIPAYRDIDPYDLPEEFAHLQAQDMGKIGCIQDLIRGIKKIISPENSSQVPVNAGMDVDAYKKRVILFLDNGEYDKANSYCDKILDVIPEDAETYCMKLCAELRVRKFEDLGTLGKRFDNNLSYLNAIKFGSPELKEKFDEQLSLINSNKLSEKRKRAKITAYGIAGILIAAALAGIIFVGISVFKEYQAKNAEKIKASKAKEIYVEAEEYVKEGKIDDAISTLNGYEEYSDNNPELANYIEAQNAFKRGDYKTAKMIFAEMPEYYDSKVMYNKSAYHLMLLEIESNNLSLPTLREMERTTKTITQTEGVDDTEDLLGQIYTLIINEAFKMKSYSACSSYMSTLQNYNPELAAKFRNEHQSEWYDTAMDIKNSLIANPRDYSSAATDKKSNVLYLMEMCDAGYKDAKVYAEVVDRDSTIRYGQRISEDQIIEEEFNYVPTNDLAKYIIWEWYSNWMIGEWKTADGSKYFNLSKSDGVYSFWADYNLPYYDSTGKSFDIDRSGVYYLFDDDDQTYPPQSAKDMYKFDIISKTQMEVFCYKDNSKYMLYKK